MSPTADLFVILLVLVFFTAAILAPVYVFLIRRRVVLHKPSAHRLVAALCDAAAAD
ncbi:MAG TPA: hypothetical protein VE974_02845 [Thermoanaerobaculia bacterium]|nr:hypothetical protein [Thermoanaerobaculia bacterium]